MKNKSSKIPKPSPFNFKKGRTEINGDSNKLSLIVLCYLRELRWLLWLFTVAVIGWLSG